MFSLYLESNRWNGIGPFIILFFFLSFSRPPARPSVRPSVPPSVFSLSLSLFTQVRELQKKKKEESVFLQVRKLQLELDMETQQAGSK